MIHVRGWSPFGSSPDTMLTKCDARHLQLRVHALLGEEDQRKLRWLQPFMQNHQISCEVLNAQHENPKVQLTRHDIKVHGKALRAGLEVSPARKARLREWFDAEDLIKQLNPAMVRLGFLHLATDTFRWCETGAATLGIKIPTHWGHAAGDQGGGARRRARRAHGERRRPEQRAADRAAAAAAPRSPPQHYAGLGGEREHRRGSERQETAGLETRRDLVKGLAKAPIPPEPSRSELQHNAGRYLADHELVGGHAE